MINEYYASINYRSRSPNWFSDTLEIDFDVGGALDHKQRTGCEPFDPGFVYKKNNSYLETTNADEHSKRGFFTAMMAFPLTVACAAFLYLSFIVIADIFSGDYDVFSFIIVAISFFAVAFASYAIVGTQSGKDWFSYRHAAIRFDRKNRKVHVFYSPKLGGPRSYDWDDVLATVTDGDGDGFYVLNMTVADPTRERFYDTFPLGGEVVKSDCMGWWEYIRRFMEEGPDSVPEPEWYLSDRLSLKESFLRWFPLREMKRDKARGLDIGPAKVRMVLMSPLLTLFSLGHFVSMLTSRRVTWPPEIRQACEEE
ncbi:DUF6708 domain-containing protein [Halomonas mongoliensis]|uniref:DUF6708 domain-containing protein n=1 Tax=Halomonas mongoliensis TaxID=321265 RepID=UPI00403AFD4C